MTPTTDVPVTSPRPHHPAVPLLVLFFIVLAALATRLPFLMHSFDELDSSNFAMGVLKFDIVHHQPHPPGQFYYIRLCQAFNFFVRDALTTLSLCSALFSCLALVPYFFAVRLAFGRNLPALAATVLTAFSYGFWLVGLRPISDPVASFFMYSTVCALLLGLNSSRWFCAGMAIFAFTLGVKQLSVYFLGPFVILVNLVALLKHGWRVSLAGAVGFALVFLGWFLPTVYNAGSLAKFNVMSKAQQVETYALESLITHLNPTQIRLHATQNFLELWGTIPLAVPMLALALFGLIPFARMSLRAKFFTVFGLSTVLYIFLVTSIFSKYFVYTAPFHCALIVAAVSSLASFASRRAPAVPARYAFAGGVALIILANVLVAGPLLGRIHAFRSPAQASYEFIRQRSGWRLSGVNALTNHAGTVTGAMRYYHAQSGLNWTNLRTGYDLALPELNAKQPLYLISLVPSSGGNAQFKPLAHFTWDPPLRRVLQSWPLDMDLYVYEILGHLPTDYVLRAEALAPLLLGRGFDPDGWVTNEADLLLPKETAPVSFVELAGAIPKDFEFRYPFVINYQVNGNPPGNFTVDAPGEFAVILPTGGPAPGDKVNLHLRAPEFFQPSTRTTGNTDPRQLVMRLTEVQCTSPDHPYMQQWVDNTWYLPETDKEHSWRWSRRNDGQLRVAVAREGRLGVAMEVVSARGGDRLNVLLDGQAVGSIDAPEPWLGPRRTLEFPVAAGLHTLTFHSDKDGFAANGDGRELGCGVHDLVLSLK